MGKGEEAQAHFAAGMNCAQAVAAAFAGEIGMDAATAARLVVGFGGGFGRMREVCGAVSGMVFVLGALRGGEAAASPEAKRDLYAAVQRVMKRFAAENGSYICGELLGGRPRGEDPRPDARTPEYYRKRPCGELVRSAANLLAAMLDEPGRPPANV